MAADHEALHHSSSGSLLSTLNWLHYLYQGELDYIKPWIGFSYRLSVLEGNGGGKPILNFFWVFRQCFDGAAQINHTQVGDGKRTSQSLTLFSLVKDQITSDLK